MTLHPLDRPACPRCWAAVRGDAPWCTQCFLDLAAREPVAAAPPSAAAGAPGRRRPGVPLTWPCLTCGAANDLDLDACVGCAAGFLAGLRAANEPLLVLPGIGDLARLGRARVAALAVGAVLALCALVLLLGLLTA